MASTVSLCYRQRESVGQESGRLGAHTSGLEMLHLQDWKGSLISSRKPCVHLHTHMSLRPRATCLSPGTACITSLYAPPGFCVPKKSLPYGTKPKVGWHLDSSYSGLQCRTLSQVSSLMSGGLSPCLLELVSKDALNHHCWCLTIAPNFQQPDTPPYSRRHQNWPKE